MNVSRFAYPAVLTLLTLALLTQTAAAEPVSDNKVNMEEVVLVEDEAESETTINLEYETGLSLRLGTFLFGSEVLEDKLLESVGVEESEAEFVSLNSESAEIVYSGSADELSPGSDLVVSEQ